MKRFLLVLLTIGLLCSCEDKRTAEWEVTYRIHYPDTTITYTKHFAGVEEGVTCGIGSYRGSNYVWTDDYFSGRRHIVDTSAPVEMVSYRKIEQ